MYPKYEQRACSRFEEEIPIVFNQLNSKRVNPAKIYNSSVSGIYFESDVPTRPGTKIDIKNSDSTRFAGLDFCHLEVVGVKKYTMQLCFTVSAWEPDFVFRLNIPRLSVQN